MIYKTMIPETIEAIQYNDENDYFDICRWITETNTSTLSLDEIIGLQCGTILVSYQSEWIDVLRKYDYIAIDENSGYYAVPQARFESLYSG